MGAWMSGGIDEWVTDKWVKDWMDRWVNEHMDGGYMDG